MYIHTHIYIYIYMYTYRCIWWMYTTCVHTIYMYILHQVEWTTQRSSMCAVAKVPLRSSRFTSSKDWHKGRWEKIVPATNITLHSAIIRIIYRFALGVSPLKKCLPKTMDSNPKGSTSVFWKRRVRDLDLPHTELYKWCLLRISSWFPVQRSKSGSWSLNLQFAIWFWAISVQSAYLYA